MKWCSKNTNGSWSTLNASGRISVFSPKNFTSSEKWEWKFWREHFFYFYSWHKDSFNKRVYHVFLLLLLLKLNSKEKVSFVSAYDTGRLNPIREWYTDKLHSFFPHHIQLEEAASKVHYFSMTNTSTSIMSYRVSTGSSHFHVSLAKLKGSQAGNSLSQPFITIVPQETIQVSSN